MQDWKLIQKIIKKILELIRSLVSDMWYKIDFASESEPHSKKIIWETSILWKFSLILQTILML